MLIKFDKIYKTNKLFIKKPIKVRIDFFVLLFIYFRSNVIIKIYKIYKILTRYLSKLIIKKSSWNEKSNFNLISTESRLELEDDRLDLSENLIFTINER